MSTAENIIGPIDYARCKNADQHGPLLHDIISNLNDSHQRMVKAEDLTKKTDYELKVFKSDTDGKFNVVNEKMKGLKETLDETKTAVSGVATTNDLSTQNKVLIDAMMEIVKGKGENKKAWIGVLGGVLVALIMAASAIFNLISNDKSEKIINSLTTKIEVLEGLIK